MSTPPGWFPNPANINEEVYWDGDHWTGDTRPVYRAADVSATEGMQGGPASEAVPQVSDSLSAENTDESENETAIPQVEEPPRKRTVLWVTLAAVLAVLLIGSVTTAVIANNIHTQQVAEQKAVAKKKADAERAKEAAAEAKQAADDAKRAQRRDTVTQVEASIKKMAEDDINKGLLTGPVLGVTCNPVSGSTDDLSDTTTTFDCFVANKDNGDGTSSGYFFNATVNWNSGSYTYGLGKSGA